MAVNSTFFSHFLCHHKLNTQLSFCHPVLQTTFGDLTEAEGEYGGSKGRRWKVDWNKTPQPIEVKLKCMRGVKDKIPGEHLVLLLPTICDLLQQNVFEAHTAQEPNIAV